MFTNDMVPYLENTEDSTINLLKLINEFSKVEDTKSIYRNQLHFYALIMTYLKEKLIK